MKQFNESVPHLKGITIACKVSPLGLNGNKTATLDDLAWEMCGRPSGKTRLAVGGSAAYV